MHKVYEILAKKAGLEKVSSGQYITCNVDFALLNDLYSTFFDSFEKLQEDLKVFDEKKCGYIFNSFSPMTNLRADKKLKKLEKLDKFNKFKYKFDIYRGTWQEELIENSLVLPDSLILSCDMHAGVLGAFSLLSLSVGEADMARAFSTGKVWLRVPELARVSLSGSANRNVTARDIALTIIKGIDRRALNYKILVFEGEYIDNCDVQAREVLCDMLCEMGVKTCFIALNEQTDVFIARKNKKYKMQESYESEEQVRYSYEYSLDVSKVVPMIATSLKAEDIKTVRELVDGEERIKCIDAFVGACQGGQMKDAELLCRGLRGKKFPEEANLVFSAASWVISRECTNLGFQTLLLDSGSAFIKPGCSSCPAMRCDTYKKTESLFTNCYRNFCGRMKIADKRVFICSALTITASLMKGFLTEP